MCHSVVVYVTVSVSVTNVQAPPSWFEFMTAILGLMRKRASPCIKKRIKCITAMVNRWSYVNKRKTAFYGRDINYEYKFTNIISHQ